MRPRWLHSHGWLQSLRVRLSELEYDIRLWNVKRRNCGILVIAFINHGMKRINYCSSPSGVTKKLALEVNLWFVGAAVIHITNLKGICRAVDIKLHSFDVTIGPRARFHGVDRSCHRYTF